MTYIKRFTDLCAAFEGAVLLVYIIRRFMTVQPVEELSLLGKLKFLMAPETLGNLRLYVLLLITLVCSFAIGRLLARFPALCFPVSLVPLCLALLMVEMGAIVERPMLYVIFGILHAMGNVLDALGRDRADGRRRAFFCAMTGGLTLPALALAVRYMAHALPTLTQNTKSLLSFLYPHIERTAETGEQAMLARLGLMLAAGVAVSLLLRDVYFVDVLLAGVPAVLAVYWVFAERLTLFPTAVLVLTVLNFATRLLVMTCEPMRRSKTAT